MMLVEGSGYYCLGSYETGRLLATPGASLLCTRPTLDQHWFGALFPTPKKIDIPNFLIWILITCVIPQKFKKKNTYPLVIKNKLTRQEW